VRERRLDVSGIPMVVVEPLAPTGGLAVWVPYFTGDRESFLHALRTLASNGMVAISLDPWQHGGRGSEAQADLFGRVFSNFRRHMWPILGRTTLDVVDVIDWAQREYGPFESVVAGGVSMGGDIAVAAAGVDHRISRVAAIGSTPDWTRPGMTVDGDPSRVVEQGEPEVLGQWLFERLDPVTNVDRFDRDVAVLFVCGEDDTHVPPEAAVRFTAALPAVATVELMPGRDHKQVTRDLAVLDRCVAWLVTGD
jgi:dienelactone hydrolase